jgi:lysophospholipase L1-like esterase
MSLRASGGGGGSAPATTAQLTTTQLAKNNAWQTRIVTDMNPAFEVFSDTLSWRKTSDNTVYVSDPLPIVESRNIGFIGDSRAFLSFTNPGGRNTYYRNLGIASAIAAATLGSAIMPTTLINGVAGETSAQILARVPAHVTAMQAAGATRTFYIGTTNDPKQSQTDVDNSKANVLAAIKLYNDAQINVDLISETPRGNGSSSYELSAGAKEFHKQLHDWMESLAGTNPKLTIHNWWDAWVDPASGSNYFVLPGVTEDGIHPSKIGAYLGSLVSGPKLLAEINNLPSILPIDNTLFNATTAPRGSLINNPMLTGTTGTKESAASVITGAGVPTGWVLGAAKIAGLTMSCAKETIGGVEYFRLNVSGVPTDTTGNPIISLKQAIPVTNLANGDSFRSVASVITAGVGISNAGIGNLLVPAYAVKYDTEDSAPNLPYPTGNTGRRSRETPPYAHDGSQTQYELRLESTLLGPAALTAQGIQSINATFWWATAKTFKG